MFYIFKKKSYLGVTNIHFRLCIYIACFKTHGKCSRYRNILSLDGFEELCFHISFIKSINTRYGVYWRRAF